MPFFEGLFGIAQNFDPNWANLFDIEQIYVVFYGQILKRLFSHLVTLDESKSETFLLGGDALTHLNNIKPFFL